MPFRKEAVPERLLEAARTRRLVPVVGSGISAQAGPFPNWRTLLTSMTSHATSHDFVSLEEARDIGALLEKDQYLTVGEELKLRMPADAYESFLEKQFYRPGVKPAEVHVELFRLRPPLILTTNYDRLLEDAYANVYRQAPVVRTYRDSVLVQKYLQSTTTAEPLIFKLHGTIDDAETIVLSERDYRRLIHRSPGYRLVLSAVFLTHVVLFLGFSFSDPELRLLLETHRESLKYRSHPDFILLPASQINAVESRRMRDDFGVHAITYEDSADHSEVLELVHFLVDQLSNGIQPGDSLGPDLSTRIPAFGREKSDAA